MDGIIKECLEAGFDTIKTVEVEKDVLSVNGVKNTYDKYTVELDADEFADFYLAVINKAEKSKELEEIVIEVMNSLDLDGDEEYEDLLDFFDYLKDDVDDYPESFEFEMNVYIDKNGEIQGREISLVTEDTYDSSWAWTCDSREDTTLKILTPHDGSKFGLELGIEVKSTYDYSDGDYFEYDDSFSIEGNGTISGGKYSGEFTYNFNDEEQDFSIVDLDLSDSSKGYVSGELRIPARDIVNKIYESDTFISSLATSMFSRNSEFSIKFAVKKHKYMLNIGVMDDDEVLFSLDISDKTSSSDSVKTPNDSKVNPIEDEDDLIDWIEDIDWDELIDGFREKGMPKKIANLLEDFIQDEVQW